MEGEVLPSEEGICVLNVAFRSPCIPETFLFQKMM